MKRYEKFSKDPVALADYITKKLEDKDRYQTVYAKEESSTFAILPFSNAKSINPE